MRSLVAVALLLSPSLALAGDEPPPAAPMPPPPPGGTGDPSQPPPPPPDGGYAQPGPGGYQQPPPPGYGAPPPGYQPQPPYQAAPRRDGLTVELNLGFGLLRFSANDMSESEGAVAGLAFGIGGWINPRTAITARFAPVTYHDSGGGFDFYFSNIFFGPSVQYWVDDHFWVGGGAGLGIAYAKISLDGQSDDDSRNGFGLDMRAGYTFSTSSENTFNISAEITPSWFSEEEGEGSAGQLTGMSIMFGYQHL